MLRACWVGRGGGSGRKPGLAYMRDIRIMAAEFELFLLVAEL